MVQEKEEVKSTSASSKKSKLSDASLDWITDTSESEMIKKEMAEIIPIKSIEVSKEAKIGVVKKYEAGEPVNKTVDTPVVTPAFSGSSTTITKGKIVASAIKEVQKTDVIMEEKPTTVIELPSIPDDTTLVSGNKTDDIPHGEKEKERTEKQEKEPEVKTEKETEAEIKGKDKTILAEEPSIEIGKTYKITEEKKVVADDEEEKTVSDKKDVVPDVTPFLPEVEVKKEDVPAKEERDSEERIVVVPDDSTTIVKRKTNAASGKEAKTEKPKAPVKKEETVTAAAKEKTSSSTKRKLLWMPAVSESLKKGGKKVSGVIVKPFKFDKSIFRKSAGAVLNVSKQPVKAVSSVDRKITRSMKKVAMFGDPGVTEGKLINKIQLTDSSIEEKY